MSENKPEYVTDALEMIGIGYDQPTVVLEAPREYMARRGGRMVKVEEPAWVKFSTDFKKELKTLDEFSLKVFIFIGLSVNWQTGTAFPGLRKIAEDTGMDKDTVAKAVENLHELGFLVIQKREGNSNIYKPIRYISIGTVPPEGTPPSDESDELSLEPPELSLAQEGNLHNKNNKSKQDNVSLQTNEKKDNQALTPEEYQQVDRKFMAIIGQVNPAQEACNAFESIFGFGALNWDTRPEWRKFAKWLVGIYQSDPSAFSDYVEWRNGKGAYKGAMTNTAIRRDPQMFMDTGWPTFLAYSSMYGQRQVLEKKTDANDSPMSY